jgi:four helix bundle protein
VLPKNVPNNEVSKQLVRAAGSIGANYIEANECLGKKDFLMKIKTSRKEAKETRYWIGLSLPSDKNTAGKAELIQEATELMNIFGSIARKAS